MDVETDASNNAVSVKERINTYENVGSKTDIGVNTEYNSDMSMSGQSDRQSEITNDGPQDGSTEVSSEGLSEALTGESIALESDISEFDVQCNFTEDDISKRVLVEGYDVIGTLKFVGLHNEKKIMRCGVELDENVGRNNGTINGFTYFETTGKKGVLVSPRKVSFVDDVSKED